MNCQQTQEELLLSFGSSELPAEIRKHVDQCEKCHAVMSSLDRLRPNALTDQDFTLPEQVTEQIQASVIESIKPQPVFSMQKALAIAASVLLVLGVSYVSYKSNGTDDPRTLRSDSTIDTVIETADLSDADETPSLDELFESVDSDPYRSSYDLLLEEITDEELDYLEKNLSAGELL
ncbi:MAG: hypothetical protein P1R58_00405 [bacterium]|nr:hypothetical protein [bacterium]